MPTFHILPKPISQKLLDQIVSYVDFTKPLIDTPQQLVSSQRVTRDRIMSATFSNKQLQLATQHKRARSKDLCEGELEKIDVDWTNFKKTSVDDCGIYNYISNKNLILKTVKEQIASRLKSMFRG